MVDKYKEISIRDVIQMLPLDEVVDALKAKGVTNEEIKMLLEMEKNNLLNDTNTKSNSNNKSR